MKLALYLTQPMGRSFTRMAMPLGYNAVCGNATYQYQNFAKVERRYFARKIDSNSWAADRLLAIGEKLEPGPSLPLTEATDELLMNPPQNIKELADDIISLNVLEINQLLKAVQVQYLIKLLLVFW